MKFKHFGGAPEDGLILDDFWRKFKAFWRGPAPPRDLLSQENYMKTKRKKIFIVKYVSIIFKIETEIFRRSFAVRRPLFFVYWAGFLSPGVGIRLPRGCKSGRFHRLSLVFLAEYADLVSGRILKWSNWTTEMTQLKGFVLPRRLAFVFLEEFLDPIFSNFESSWQWHRAFNCYVEMRIQSMFFLA